jgi:PAS domain S-box-containing protein
LRRRAEERLGEKTGTTNPPGTEDEPLRLHHELQVHQVELEMQNAELRQARDELETALEEYTDLYDFAPVGYFTLDRKGDIRRVNLTGAALVGIERSRLVGQRFGLFVTNETRPAFTAFLEKVFTSPVKVACEVALRKEGNDPLCVQVEGMAAASGQKCRIALMDITERKEAEDALRKGKELAEETLRVKNEAAEALRMAEEAGKALRLEKEAAEALRLEKKSSEAASRLKSQFLANMSHELRTPMTGVLGMLDIVLLGNLEAEQREFIEIAYSSARSLVRILNDILDMTKIEMGKLSIDEKIFSIRKCVENTCNILFPATKSKGLDIVCIVADDVPETLVGDQARLNQVLTNLAGNAVKFTEKGKVEMHVVAGNSRPDGKREITFTVTDTGIGIPDDKKERLFGVFSQVDESHSRSYGGTGLGLAISKELVERMGGTIFFTSNEGVGSTFSFTIPLGQARLENNTLPAAEPVSPETAIPDLEVKGIPCILLAEDDSITRQVILQMLKQTKYNVDIAEDGLKAVEMWEKGEYDLVLMDVQMPRLNGFEATSAIREKERVHGGHTPIVAMTAHARKEDEERCLAAGMDGYISKPIDFQNCLQVIGDIIRQTATP